MLPLLLLLCLVATGVQSLAATNNNTGEKPIPITILSGFLGSGKTTLLQHLLQNEEGLRIAVIVNDVAAVNIDSKLISGGSMSQAAGMVELQNGCACCSLSDELLVSVSELVTLSDMRGDDDKFHHIVVELSGVADPKSVRAKFQEAILYDMPLMERVRLDTLATVVDCSMFLEHLQSSKGATAKEAPELFYRDGQQPQEEDSEAWMEGMPAPLVEALLAGQNSATTMGSSSDGVADLLVGQTETADVVLLNKIDLVDDKTSSRIEQVVHALNPRATVLPSKFGAVDPMQILAFAGGKGVVEAGVVDDHKDAVDAAMNGIKANTLHSSTQSKDFRDPDCPDHSHSHSHGHEPASDESSDSSSPSHGIARDAAKECSDPGCTDPSHSHSHSHSHLAEDCSDPSCSDPTHSHSHSHSPDHAGIGTYVYRARRPFHPGRLAAFLRHLPVTRGLPSTEVEESLNISTEADSTLKRVLRSKGFVWCADSNVAALYWSHAGSSFEMQCLGRWWATLPRSQWPSEVTKTILDDFDDPDHHEGEGVSVGDRRQEIVFIGYRLAAAQQQNHISNALDQCLLTSEEWTEFRSNVPKEESLRSRFVNPISFRTASY